MCFRLSKVIFVGWLKFVIQAVVKCCHLVTLTLLRSVFHAVTCASSTQSYIYMVFYEIVDECFKTRWRHVVINFINLLRVVFF